MSEAKLSAAAAGALCTELEHQRYLVALLAVGAEVHPRTAEDHSGRLRSAKAEVSAAPSGTVLHLRHLLYCHRTLQRYAEVELPALDSK